MTKEEYAALSKQQQRIVDYIQEFGSISPLEAFRDIGVTKLATQVSFMRKYHGIEFKKEFKETTNRFGEKCHYMRYYLPNVSNRSEEEHE